MDIEKTDISFFDNYRLRNLELSSKNLKTDFGSLVSHNTSAFMFNPYHSNIFAYNEGEKLNIAKINNNQVEIGFNYKDHFQHINCLKFNMQGNLLVSGANDAMVNIYDLNSGKLMRNILEDSIKSGITCCDVNYSSNLLLTGVYDRTVSLYDIRMNKPAYKCLAHSEPITSVSFSQTSNLFISTSYDGFIRIWDLFKGTCLKTVSLELSPAISKGIITPDEDHVLVSTVSDYLELFNIITEETIFKYKGKCNDNLLCDFDLINNDLIVSGSENGHLNFWKLSNDSMYYNLNLSKEIKSYENDNTIIQTLSCSSENKIIGVVLQEDSTVKRFNNSVEEENNSRIQFYTLE